MRPLTLVLPAALLLLSWAAPARAETTRFALLYRPAPECPAREAFIAELTARSPWLRESATEPPSVSLDVWFETAEPLTGVLVLRDSEGRATMRRIPGGSCAEVAPALALIASVLIDAQRRETPAPPPASPAPPARARVEEDRAPEEIEEDADTESPSQFRVGLAAGVAVEDGVSPSLALAGAGELYAEWTRPSIVQPLISATLERTLTEEVQNTWGVARFRWTAVRLAGCPLRLPAKGSAFFRPCANFEGGVIDADGSQTEAEASATAAWWAAGISGRSEFRVAGPLAFVLEIGARLQLTQDRFYFDPDSPGTTVFEVPAAGLFGRAGVQASF